MGLDAAGLPRGDAFGAIVDAADAGARSTSRPSPAAYPRFVERNPAFMFWHRLSGHGNPRRVCELQR